LPIKQYTGQMWLTAGGVVLLQLLCCAHLPFCKAPGLGLWKNPHAPIGLSEQHS